MEKEKKKKKNKYVTRCIGKINLIVLWKFYKNEDLKNRMGYILEMDTMGLCSDKI